MKSIYYTLSVAGKEIRLIVADRGLLAVLLLLPILLGSLFAGLNLMLASEEGETNILLEVVLVNEDPGNFGSEVAKSVRAIDELNVKHSSSVSTAEQRVAEGKVAAAIIIPSDFSEKIDSYTPTEIEVIIDPAQVETASIVTGTIDAISVAHAEADRAECIFTVDNNGIDVGVGGCFSYIRATYGTSIWVNARILGHDETHTASSKRVIPELTIGDDRLTGVSFNTLETSKRGDVNRHVWMANSPVTPQDWRCANAGVTFRKRHKDAS